MILRTEIEKQSIATREETNFSHYDTFFAIGSCFASNIASYLDDLRFNIECNPFGAMFNPMSIASALRRLSCREFFDETDLFYDGGLWGTLSAGTLLRRSDKVETLSILNSALTRSAEALERSREVIITLGTAWVYRDNESGEVVANCHKLPASRFTRERLSVDATVAVLEELFASETFKSKHITITVSPIRHLKDTLHGNQLSKSTLLLAAEALSQKFSNIDYFPSYEIMNDDLRDYRFYETDLIHPSSVAVEYICELFCESRLSNETLAVIPEIKRICSALAHRHSDTSSDNYRIFATKTLERIDALKKRLSVDIFKDKRIFFSNIIDNNL